MSNSMVVIHGSDIRTQVTKFEVVIRNIHSEAPIIETEFEDYGSAMDAYSKTPLISNCFIDINALYQLDNHTMRKRIARK